MDLPLRILFYVSFLLLLLFAASPSEAQLFPDRGYQPRGCGFDLDDDGLVGEPADDCQICNGLESDPDGDGVDEDLIYVDCDTGTDSPSCGTPNNPCRSLNYALVTVADGPADGAEDIVCVKGTCPADLIKPNTRGIPGHRTAPASGSDEFDFQYPTNPAMIVGWDFDADGQYPPFDSDDRAVIDGSAAGRAFLMNNGRSNDHFEIAHLEARDFNRYVGVPASSGGFLKANQGRDTSHLYVHDIEMRDMSAGKELGSGAIVFDLFSLDGMEYFAVENIRSLNTGGYFGRGSGSDGQGSASSIRFKNVTVESHGGCTNCAPRPNRTIAFRIWGYLNRFEILDSKFDGNLSSRLPGVNDPGSDGVHLLHCLQDVSIRNNEFRDLKSALAVDPGEWGCDLLPRSTDDIVFDRNSYIVTRALGYQWGGSGVVVAASDSNVKTLLDLDITNNFFSGPDGGLSSCLYYSGGNDLGPNGGTIRYSHNTCHGDLFLNRGALHLLDIRNYKHENWVVENNIVAGLGSGDFAISTSYNPLNWASRSNSFSPGAGFQWNRSSRLDLAAFQASSQSEGGSNSCEASLENPGASDLHLRMSDTCARDRGVTTSLNADIDGQVRTSSDPRDRGADEAGATGGTAGAQPTIQLQSPAEEECVSQGSVQVAGYGDHPAGVVGIRVNGSQAAMSPAQNHLSETRVSFQATVNLQAGANTLDTRLSASDGGTVDDQRTVYRDLGAPLLNWSSTIDPNDPNLGLVQGTVDDESGVSSVRVNGTSVALQSSFSGGLSFNHSVTLSEGTNEITVEAVDQCQNVTTQSDQLDVSSNSGPTVYPATIQTQEERAVGIQLSGNDPDGDQLTYEVVDAPEHGVLSGVPPALSYLPNLDYSGPDQLRFRATDGQTYSSTVAVNITVADVNDLPVAREDAFVALSGERLTVPAPGVLGNDADVDGDSLSVSVSAAPQHGSLSLSANGSFHYTSTSGYAGGDSFTYRVSDGRGGLSTTRVNLTVQGTQSGDVAVTLGSSIGLVDGASLRRSGSFSSRSSDAAATVNYGDGSGVQPLALVGRRFELNHRFPGPGVYLVEVCVASSSGSGCGSVRVFQKLSTRIDLSTASVEASSGLWVDAVLRDSQNRTIAGAPLELTSDNGCRAQGITDVNGYVLLGCNGTLPGGGQLLAQVHYAGLDRDTLAPSTVSRTIIVSPDTVLFEASPANVMVIQTQGTKFRSDRVDFVMNVRERLDGGSQPGNLRAATVTMEVVPMTNGEQKTANCDERVQGTGLDQVLTATCRFTELLPDVYWLRTVVGGSFSGEHYESFVVAREPWGIHAGAGSFIWPGTEDPLTGYPGDRATFAFNSLHGVGQIPGKPPTDAFAVVRTFRDGTSTRFRARSFDVSRTDRRDGARVVELAGDGELWERGSLQHRNGLFSLYTTDRSDNGSRDEVWMSIFRGANQPYVDLEFEEPRTQNLETLTDGNVVVY
ncbi:MAG: Ig-like domain-containing protein [Acidobacteriota bacterium]